MDGLLTQSSSLNWEPLTGLILCQGVKAVLLQCCGPVNTVALDRLHFWLATYSAQTALGLMAVMAVLWAVL